MPQQLGSRPTFETPEEDARVFPAVTVRSFAACVAKIPTVLVFLISRVAIRVNEPHPSYGCRLEAKRSYDLYV